MLTIHDSRKRSDISGKNFPTAFQWYPDTTVVSWAKESSSTFSNGTETGTYVASLEGILHPNAESDLSDTHTCRPIGSKTEVTNPSNASSRGCQWLRWVPRGPSTRAVLCGCGTQPRTRFDRRHSGATRIKTQSKKHNFSPSGPEGVPEDRPRARSRSHTRTNGAADTRRRRPEEVP